MNHKMGLFNYELHFLFTFELSNKFRLNSIQIESFMSLTHYNNNNNKKENTILHKLIAIIFQFNIGIVTGSQRQNEIIIIGSAPSTG